ncbi:hypothetical protein JSE7799_02581 [Jannaschia seosinensis]|uniref:Uncharacterized protein n=1 Tax=Jannaschia seosinensis TaxID=313367 RepID=A0A0M7BD73_9RHOB|nr:hypothetical protein [Jannaschia seosinensis]CUH39853.1 hypothetical protein JSE7799_02581 [Jannaschia seosinensis]
MTGQPPRELSPQSLTRAIVQQDDTVGVCAIYLPGRGEDPGILLNGAASADAGDTAARLIASDTRIMRF